MLSPWRRIVRMLSEDPDVRRRQMLGLALIGIAFLGAIPTGLLWGAIATGEARGTVGPTIGATAAVFVVLLSAAALWAAACKEDLRRHPDGNVARNRLIFRSTPPPAR